MNDRLPASASYPPIDTFGRAMPMRADFTDWWDSLPRVGAGLQLRELAEAVAAARAGQRAVHLALGAGVVEAGLGPILVDLLERHAITAVSVDTAFLRRELAVAATGRQDPDDEHVAKALAEIVATADKTSCGLGEAAARFLAYSDWPHARASVLAAGYHNEAPVTVYATADEPDFASVLHQDFATLTTLVRNCSGGVFIGIGSAEALSDVWGKGVAAARDAGDEPTEVTVASLDATQRDEPIVCDRELIGPLEIMLPLLAAAVCRLLWAPTEDE